MSGLKTRRYFAHFETKDIALTFTLFVLTALLTGCSVTAGNNSNSKIKPSSRSSVMNFVPPAAADVASNNTKKDNPKKQNAKQGLDNDKKMPSLAEAVNKPLTPEQTEELLDEVGSNWLYGQGMGETALTVGAIALFPPYALAVLGNAALQISGEEPVGVSTVLPDEAAENWTEFYDGVTSVPGRGVAYVSDEEFRDKEIARERILSVLNKAK